MEAYSSGRGPGALRQLITLARYKLKYGGDFADVKYRAFVQIRAALELGIGKPLRDQTLVEIGCGQWQANVKLFAAMGNIAIGVDPELPPQSLTDYPRFIRECGLQRGIKTGLNELLLRRKFDRRLEELSNLPPRPSGIRVHRLGGETLPIESGSVDAVYSDNVFEHISDVPSVTAEINRILRPGGFMYVIVHPFAAYSGGHHLSVVSHGAGESDGGGIPAWDHLRENKFPSGTYLNGLRAPEYQAIFDGVFPEVSCEEVGPEGEAHLTDEIEAELVERGYTRDEVLTGKLTYSARKGEGA